MIIRKKMNSRLLMLLQGVLSESIIFKVYNLLWNSWIESVLYKLLDPSICPTFTRLTRNTFNDIEPRDYFLSENGDSQFKHSEEEGDEGILVSRIRILWTMYDSWVLHRPDGKVDNGTRLRTLIKIPECDSRSQCLSGCSWNPCPLHHFSSRAPLHRVVEQDNRTSN